MRIPLLLAAVLAVGLVSSACTADTAGPDPVDETVRPTWHQATLPMPAGASGRIAVRDAVACAGETYVVGGVFDTDGNSVPAAWRSPDGVSWTTLPLAPVNFWAKLNVLFSIACRDGEVALIGAKSGGAHGIPRVSTWYRGADGSYVDVVSGYTLYGGPEGVSVGRLAAGPPGWIINGNRTSGGAVWNSADATEFTRVDGAPRLASDAEFDTATRDVTWTGEQWTVVGGAARTGRVPRIPLAWVSADGLTWTRQDMPYGEGNEDLQKVLAARDGTVAIGLRGDGFGEWTRDDAGSWRIGPAFGALDPAGAASPFVSGVAAAGDWLFATVSDGARYGMWVSEKSGSWLPMDTPERPSTAGEHVMTAVVAGNSVVLLTDDGQAGKVWTAAAMGDR